MKMTLIPFGESDYNELLLQAVAVLDQARSSLAIKISDTISNAHWNLGKLLTEKKLESKHGSAVVNRLSSDLKRRFPDMGVSPRNLWNMKRFYERYRNEDKKLLQAVAVLPWGHNLILLDKGLDSTRVAFYAQEIISKGWSRDMLLNALKGGYYENLLTTPQSNNFSQTLPAPVADYANEVFRSRYNLGFIGVKEPMKELKLERRLYLPILFKYVFRFRKDKKYFTNLAIFANYCQNLYICRKEAAMDFRVEITPLMKDVTDALIKECEGVNSCIVQHPRNLVVEVSRGEIPAVVSALKKYFPDVVDIRKAYPMIEDLHDFILVKPFTSEAPVFQEEGIPVPTIEKMLVDRVSDKEYVNIETPDSVRLFQKAMEAYNVNTSRLVRYAARKGKKEEVNEILSKIDKGRLATIKGICKVLSTAPVLRAWLFGSYARMEEKPDSDIDILVSLDKSAHIGLMAFSGLVNQLEQATGRAVDLVPEESLKPYARESVNRDKYLVYERA